MTRRPRYLTIAPAVVLAIFVASACSDSDSDSSDGDGGPVPGGDPAAADDAAAEPTGGDEPATTPEAGDGTVTVDGVAYVATELRNCEPLADSGLDEGAGIERELELQAMVSNGGETGIIHVYVETIGGMPFDEVSWSGPEGVYGASVGETDVDITVEGGRTHGSATINDAMDGTESVTVEFDLPVPAEVIDCSL